MALSNAERQRRHKMKLKEKGLVRKESWTDRDGFFSDTLDGSGERLRISSRKFTRDLNKLMENVMEASAEEIYAALLSHAKRLKQNYERVETMVDKIVEEEKAAGKWA